MALKPPLPSITDRSTESSSVCTLIISLAEVDINSDLLFLERSTEFNRLAETFLKLKRPVDFSYRTSVPDPVPNQSFPASSVTQVKACPVKFGIPIVRFV